MSTAPRTLPAGRLNRALLARQLLLSRARVGVPQALQRMAGLQAQYAPAMYVGLFSRVDALRRDRVTDLLQARTVVQGTLLRSTIHLVSRQDYWPFALAVRSARRQQYLKVVRGRTEAQLRRLAERVRAELVAGPLSYRQLQEIAGDATGGVGLWLDLVRVPPSGTWHRRRADLYGDAQYWLGPAPADLAASVAARHLVRRYLAGFGPASRTDIATWSGLRLADVDVALQQIPLRHFRTEQDVALVDLRGAPLPAAGTPAPVRFLPVWDASLLVHARRSGILPEEYRPLIFTSKNPQSVGTFLVDGAVAGSWRLRDGRVVTEPFAPLPPGVRAEVEDEAALLTAFHG